MLFLFIFLLPIIHMIGTCALLGGRNGRDRRDEWQRRTAVQVSSGEKRKHSKTLTNVSEETKSSDDMLRVSNSGTKNHSGSCIGTGKFIHGKLIVYWICTYVIYTMYVYFSSSHVIIPSSVCVISWKEEGFTYEGETKETMLLI